MPDVTRQSIEAEIEAFNTRWPEAWHGPAHIALDDGNLDDDNLRFCLGLCDKALSGHADYSDHTFEELQATQGFLQRLLTYSEDIRTEWEDQR